MERNGLLDRRRETKVGKWVLGVSGFFLLSFFVAPFTLEAGTVGPMEGRANAVDFYDEEGFGSSGNENQLPHEHEGEGNHTHTPFSWTDVNPYAAFIYAFGDVNCHQKHERSWEVNNNQLPVCTRDVGIFFGLFLGGVVFTRRGWNRWTVRDTCLSLLPERMLHPVYAKNQRTLLWLACGTLLCLPLIADGFLQLLTSYESTNVKRILTGIPFGLGLGILMCSMFSARAEDFHRAGQVLLPGNASFSLVRSTHQEDE
ncbi:MAG: DUF2085 domain-containing protein [Candidatus Poseidoniales archaeon]